MQVFWSYTNEFPCNGSPKEFDGFFQEERVMRIGNPQEHRFPQAHVYLAIYAKSSSFSDTLMYSCGEGALKELDVRLKQKIKAANYTPQAETIGSSGAFDKDGRIMNARDKLVKFKADT